MTGSAFRGNDTAMTIDQPRICPLNEAPPDPAGRYVLYWMQQAQRAEWNHALEYAIARAAERGLGVVVGFALLDFPGAQARHYAFMLDGLAETAATLMTRGIKLVVRRGDAPEIMLSLARDAALVVCDRACLRDLRAKRLAVAQQAGKEMVEIDADCVVPVDFASPKQEYAARTIRPKIQEHWRHFLRDPGHATPARPTRDLPLASDVDPADPAATLARLSPDTTAPPVDRFRGGLTRARARLQRFLDHRLTDYANARSDPSQHVTSTLSPYLQYGQISVLEVVDRLRKAQSGSPEDRRIFIEELIVRRELAANYAWYCPDYDSYAGLPDWARRTLATHAEDPREYLYSQDQLVACATHDPYWNAAMREMVRSGYMHNYMRMYWGKKVLEWSVTPERAHATLVMLNDRYLLDGFNANSYTGIGWIFGLHDRPWFERDIFGTVRYMAASGLKRKFDIDAYERWSHTL